MFGWRRRAEIIKLGPNCSPGFKLSQSLLTPHFFSHILFFLILKIVGVRRQSAVIAQCWKLYGPVWFLPGTKPNYLPPDQCRHNKYRWRGRSRSGAATWPAWSLSCYWLIFFAFFFFLVSAGRDVFYRVALASFYLFIYLCFPFFFCLSATKVTSLCSGGRDDLFSFMCRAIMAHTKVWRPAALHRRAVKVE